MHFCSGVGNQAARSHTQPVTQPLSDMLAASSLDSGLSGLGGLALLPATWPSLWMLDVTTP